MYVCLVGRQNVFVSELGQVEFLNKDYQTVTNNKPLLYYKAGIARKPKTQ